MSCQIDESNIPYQKLEISEKSTILKKQEQERDHNEDAYRQQKLSQAILDCEQTLKQNYQETPIKNIQAEHSSETKIANSLQYEEKLYADTSPSPAKLGISSKIQEERNRNLVLLQEMQRLTNKTN